MEYYATVKRRTQALCAQSTSEGAKAITRKGYIALRKLCYNETPESIPIDGSQCGQQDLDGYLPRYNKIEQINHTETSVRRP